VEIGILALQGDVAEHRAALSALGVAVRSVRRAEDLVGLDGIVLPGGESTTVSMLLESSGLLGPLGQTLATGLPALGTCAGMILLGRSITGGRSDQRCYGVVDITVRRNGFGRQLDSFECDIEVPAIGTQPFHAVFIRAPLVETVGAGVEVLSVLPPPCALHVSSGPTGSGDDGPGDEDAGGKDASDKDTVPVLCRQGPVLVAAFHPELTHDYRVHELFVSTVARAMPPTTTSAHRHRAHPAMTRTVT
jgi:5'-phosphate synthase pdxT subunit